MYLGNNYQGLDLQFRAAQRRSVNPFGATAAEDKQISLNDFEFVSENKGYGRRYHHLQEGTSKYNYYGCDFTFRKHNDEVRGQYVTPEDVDAAEMVAEFKEEVEATPAPTNLYRVEKNSNGINGKIDEGVYQGSTGDCWILTGINALNSTEKGRQILSDSIMPLDDGSVVINFKGLDTSYLISADEIKKHDTDNNLYDAYSNGDNDMLAIELATEKLWKDIKEGNVDLGTKKATLKYTGNGNGITDGGYSPQIIYYLTGIASDEYYRSDLTDMKKDFVYQCLRKGLENENSAMTVNIYNGVHSAKLIDGSTYTLDLGNTGHALAITDIKEGEVSFTNPWDSTEVFTMTWAEFAKLGIGYISYTDLSSYVPEDLKYIQPAEPEFSIPEKDEEPEFSIPEKDEEPEFSIPEKDEEPEFSIPEKDEQYVVIDKKNLEEKFTQANSLLTMLYYEAMSYITSIFQQLQGMLFSWGNDYFKATETQEDNVTEYVSARKRVEARKQAHKRAA